jgi:hypothetical protein
VVTAKEIDRQLKNIGVSFWFFGNAELRELRHILVEGETIEHCLVGRYEGGFAILCATDLRLLLIDKKPFYLTLEDVRYDMVVEVDYALRLLDASIRVLTPNKTLRFTSMRKPDLRNMTTYIQQQVMAYRQQHMMEGGVQMSTVPPVQVPAPLAATPGWQPQQLIDQTTLPPKHSVKNIALTALDGATRVTDLPTVTQMRQAINPYARSSFTIRQRISRF